ncbi:unnamed protein product [Clonostachys rosea]|uniref:SGNH hydrolase-type esterase domain-containing protein n=1 Tax=Bionectria ochroleuca TaxID=29856 RepID=A0ABY6UNK5_BIOOC|nr:unnamed protein product [Clonostachys rosea]
MKSHLYTISVFALAYQSLVAANEFNLKKWSSVVIFGDSWTDQGTYSYIPNENGTLSEPKLITATGTSTGGRIWPQYIKQYSNQVNVYNYAVSGAMCDTLFSPTNRNGVEQNQVPAFLKDLAWKNETSGAPAIKAPADETVYAIWIGTNDLGYAAFLAEQQPHNMPLTAFSDCVYEQFDRVYQAGGRHFVIMNLGALELTPLYATLENNGIPISRFWKDKSIYDANITRTSEKIRQYSSTINTLFEYQTPYEVQLAKRYPKSSFALFDTASLISNMWHNPGTYLNGTTELNVTGSYLGCMESGCYYSNPHPDSFLWYDELHPSEQANRWFAKEFIEVVKGNSKMAKYWKSK